MGAVWSELRSAARALARAPSFTFIAVVTLALGIGGSTAIFSVFDELVLRPLPYPEPDELVAVWLDRSGRDGLARAPLSSADLQALRSEPSLFREVAGWRAWRPTLMDSEGATVVEAAAVSDGMIARVLGIQPSLGRAFRPEEHRPGGTRTVVLSHTFWVERFYADPGVLGRAIRLDDEPYTVVGVMPEGFKPPFAATVRLWTPVLQGPVTCGAVPARSPSSEACGPPLNVIGRLSGGMTLAVARDRVVVATRRATETIAGALVGVTVSLRDLRSDLLGTTPRRLQTLLIAMVLVLLVACTNVAGMLLVRGVARQREFGVRRALGADHSVMVRHLAAESLLLGAIGGVIGLGFGVWGTEALMALAPTDFTLFGGLGLNRRVLAFAASAAVVSGLAAGAVSARQVARSVHAGFAPRRSRGEGVGDQLRRGAVAGQLALTTVLLVGAGLMLRSLSSLDGGDLGFDPEDVYALTFAVPEPRVSGLPVPFAPPEGPRAFYGALRERVLPLRGVVALAASSAPPMSEDEPAVQFIVRGEDEMVTPGTSVSAVRSVTPGYFYTVGQRLLDGRTFHERDDSVSAGVAIVSETLARRFFDYPRASALGRRLALPREPERGWRTIVGVVADTRDSGVRHEAAPRLYLPFEQAPTRTMTMLVKADGPTPPLEHALRRALADVDPSVAPTRLEPLTVAVLETIRPERFATRLVTTFAALALVLSAVGVYGIIGYRVARGLREMGIRLAVGAAADDVRQVITQRAVLLSLTGIVVGSAGAFLIGGLIESLLYGVPTLDPWTLGGTALVLVATAFLAARVPSRRAVNVDPVRVLREE